MKILIAGLGSAGQRHVRNLRRLYPDIEISAWRNRGLDIVLDDQMIARSGKPEDAFDLEVFSSLEAGLDAGPDAIVIANPISMHVDTARAAADRDCAIFVEKPLGDRWDGVEELLNRAASRPGTVGYQSRFHPALQRVRSILDSGSLGRVISAQLFFREYLPAMHPWEDYRISHAARRREGGGVILCLSHEIDIAKWLFGIPRGVFATGGHLSELDVDVEDSATIQMECLHNGRPLPVSVTLDFLRRPAERSGEIVGDQGTLRWDLLEPSVSTFDPDVGQWEVERFHDFQRNQLFLDEMQDFVEAVRGGQPTQIPLSDGAETLDIALAARRSLASRALETPFLSQANVR